MTRLKFDDVQAILVNKGYEAEKVAGGYKSQGHRFRNLTELKFWAEGLPVIKKEAQEEPYHDDSQEQCDEPGEIDNPLPLPKTEFEIYQEAATQAVLTVGSGLDAESVEERGAVIAEALAQDFCWEEVRDVINDTVAALVKRTGEAMNIWTLIPERWRTLARGFLKRHYLSKIQASCRSFAEMVKVSRMVDKLV